MKTMKKLLVLLAFMLPVLGFAQTGSSCAHPYYIYPATSCNNNSGAQYAGGMQCPTGDCSAYVTAAGSSGGLNPSCTTDNETTQNVVWLAVTATSTSFTINNGSPYVGGGAAASNARDYVVYSGTCGSLTQIYCSTIAANSSGTVTGLTAGQMYYVMVSPASTNTTANATNVCITSGVGYMAPGNTCATYQSLTTNVTYTYTNAGATANGPICSGSVENDVWYRWCAPSTWTTGQQAYLSVYDQVCNSTLGLQLSVWNTNTTCPTLASNPNVVCQNPGTLTQYYYQWTAVANQCYYITLDGFAGTACRYNITVGSLIVLPIELLSFDANIVAKGVNLKWVTATETNNDYFTLERSVDGFDFSEIGKVQGSGNSTELKNYNFVDEEPVQGISYYRLKQTDFDGLFTYTDILPVRFSFNNKLFSVQPNPSKEKTDITYYANGRNTSTIRIYDMLGNIRKEIEKDDVQGINKVHVDVSNFAKGMYFITLENGTDNLKLRFIKD